MKNPLYDQFPATKIDRILAPAYRFFQLDTAAGLVMIIFMLFALIWANSPWHASYEALLATPVGFSIGSWEAKFSLIHWVNDGLMTIFFFLVGLEIKKEFLAGDLSTPKKAVVPIVAAFGGMIAPAIIYLLFNSGTPYAKGWAIPTATDIAFAMGAISLLGNRVPISLKIFLTALAIADDIGAIAVIALFYGGTIHLTPLVGALIVFSILFWGSKMDIRSLLFYMFFTFLLWVFIFQSGIHATLAGVIAAVSVPFKSYLSERDFTYAARAIISEYESANSPNSKHLDVSMRSNENTQIFQSNEVNIYHSLTSPQSIAAVQKLQTYCTYVESPLRALERLLHTWSSFFIVPIFTLCNAGIRVDSSALQESFSDPVMLGVAFGLAFGKPFGIFSFCYILNKSGWIQLSEDISSSQLFGVACLAGIGFTMSLFVSNLAFSDLPHRLNDAKIGILAGSFTSVLIGLSILFHSKKKSFY